MCFILAHEKCFNFTAVQICLDVASLAANISKYLKRIIRGRAPLMDYPTSEISSNKSNSN